MAVVMLALALGLLLQGCYSIPTNKGCMDWYLKGDDACCKTCHPGHRMVKKCGPRVLDLCTPCEPETFTLSFNEFSCDTCSQCAGALVLKKNCTPTSDTVCGCKEGLTCGDARCSFCVEKCLKGQEPTDDGSCRPCPDGTFNDRSHLKCKPWSTMCLKPNQRIVAKGDAFTDITCVDVPDPGPVVKPQTPDNADISWLLVISLIAGVAVIFIVTVVVTIARSKKNPKKPIIRPPSDDPQTLIAIECSFHEAEQERGSSSESLDSQDSSGLLVR